MVNKIGRIFVIGLVLILIGCGGGNENTDQTLTELQGTWRSNCVTETDPTTGEFNVIVEFTIANNSSVQFKEFFASGGCITSLVKMPDPDATIVLGSEITTANGDTAKRMDVTYISDGSKAYGIYKLENNTVLLWVDDETKQADDNGIMRFNELRYDVIFTKQ